MAANSDEVVNPAIKAYEKSIKSTYSLGDASELTYRGSILKLFEKIDLENQNIPINEATGEIGAKPDVKVLRKRRVVGFVETKNIGLTLRDNTEQIKRYKNKYENLIFTNYLDWKLYRKGEIIENVTIAKFEDDDIRFNRDTYYKFENLIFNFLDHVIDVTDPKELAKRMARKSKEIRPIILNSLKSNNEDLMENYKAFKNDLINNITLEGFAEIYAETITYGLFAARLYSKKSVDFNKNSCSALIPNSYPFLKKLFRHIESESELSARAIDELVLLLKSSDVDKILGGFENIQNIDDAFLYFYEYFIEQYNPKKRKDNGVYYTPIQIVKYMIQIVNDILVDEFELDDGLNTNIKIKNSNYHKVQILDPAAGTGTFLAEIIRFICDREPDSTLHEYIENDLIPRVHGFEIMMAPHIICHLKLGMMLKHFGYENLEDSSKELSVFLTNTLEMELEGKNEHISGFYEYLYSQESKKAEEIKRDTPIMCIIGNPPYKNNTKIVKNSWIYEQLRDYFVEPNSDKPLEEDQVRHINDLYVQFIRWASYMFERKGRDGIMAFITNHGFLENTTFRTVRWHLLKNFDKIYVLDLNGQSGLWSENKNKTDENVFSGIQQGVSIIFAVKKHDSTNDLAELKRLELKGTREEKYLKLVQYDSLRLENYNTVVPQHNKYYFKEWNYDNVYYSNSFFSIDELMPVFEVGIVSGHNKFAYETTEMEMKNKLEFIEQNDENEIVDKYGNESTLQSLRDVKYSIGNKFSNSLLIKINHRPFDSRFTYFKQGFLRRPKYNFHKNFEIDDQVALAFVKQTNTTEFSHVFVTDLRIDQTYLYSGATRTAPLYILQDEGSLYGEHKRVNFCEVVKNKIINVAIKNNSKKPNELNIFDYVYAVLHCSNFKKKYNEFLLDGFPRIPYPTSSKEFWKLSDEGKKLRLLHLMNPKSISELQVRDTFFGNGDNVVKFAHHENECVWINDSQGFSDVSDVLWNFKLGGDNIAERWLKDHKGKSLSRNDLKLYPKIIKILEKTKNIVNSLNLIKIDN